MRFKFESSVFFCRMLLALVLTLLGGVLVDAQCSVQQTAMLLADDGVAGDSLGASVAISGTIAIAGAPKCGPNASGSAYLFDTVTGQQLSELMADDGLPCDGFGWSVAISGNIVVVGNPFVSNQQVGAAYLFDTNTGQQIAKLIPNGAVPSDDVAMSVAISGTTVIVGAGDDDDNGDGSGAAYLFDTTTGQQTFKLLADDGAAHDGFGDYGSVSIDGTTAIVGAYRDDDNGDNSGSAYLFDTTTGQQIHKLLPDDGAADDRFGHYVSIDGTTAIVGAWRDDDNGTNSGSAYLFDTTTGQQIAKLLPDDGVALDYFGSGVAISGNIAIVGSNAGPHSGKAYLFDTTTGIQIATVLANDGEDGDSFCSSISIDGTTAIVGARYDDTTNGNNSGSAYLFDFVCSDVVSPDSLLVTRGTHVSGDVVDLAESDNADLSIRRSDSDIQSRTEFEIQGVSPVASPASLEITLEGSVFARSQVNQTIELFDYVASGWEQIDTREASRLYDSTVTVAATGDLSRFVEAGTNRIEARIRYQSLNPRQRFSSNTDQFIWSIGQ